MSSHPNAIIMCVITPDNLARKTMRDIVGEADQINIGGFDYNFFVAEDDYEEGYQISAPEGSLVFHDFLTYGYGEICEWEEIEKRKLDLTEWASEICKKHAGTFKIQITANFW